jgi:hypothetical protein
MNTTIIQSTSLHYQEGNSDKVYHAAIPDPIRETSDTSFLRAWWALCWLHPSLHPDDHEEWPHASWREFAAEAFRRAKAGTIRDHELYPAEATRNRLWRTHLATHD